MKKIEIIPNDDKLTFKHHIFSKKSLLVCILNTLKSRNYTSLSNELLMELFIGDDEIGYDEHVGIGDPKHTNGLINIASAFDIEIAIYPMVDSESNSVKEPIIYINGNGCVNEPLYESESNRCINVVVTVQDGKPFFNAFEFVESVSSNQPDEHSSELFQQLLEPLDPEIVHQPNQSIVQSQQIQRYDVPGANAFYRDIMTSLAKNGGQSNQIVSALIEVLCKEAFPYQDHPFSD